MINLQAFCANSYEERSYLRQPFMHRGYQYATNGHIIVRIPAPGTESINFPFKPGSAAEGLFADSTHAAHSPLPAYSLGVICKICAGTGQNQARPGSLRECALCGGYGSFFKALNTPIAVFDVRYFNWISKLPNARIALQPFPKPSHFIFDGGEGLLAPIDPETL